MSKNHKKYENSGFVQITPIEMLHYLGLDYATAMVKVKRLRWYWRVEKPLSSLIGNDYFKNTMSGSLFCNIRRGFQENLEEFMAHYNNVSKKYWNLAERVCFDDDLEKCESKSSEKMYISRKA